MKTPRPRLVTGMSILSLVTAFSTVPGGPVNAQSVQHLTITHPGGMPGLPVMTGVTRLTNGVSVTWDGPSGYYQLFQTPALEGLSWQAVGAASLLRQAAVTPLSSNAFFRVSGPSPYYGSSNACAECHQSILSTEINTPHPQAFQALQQIHQDTNSACLACHTVGYGLPTGFSSAAATPQLEGVQCENCHGPAANHAAVYFDPTVWPRVELAATVCGGCHTGPQHPTYEEWTSSAHSQVPGQSAGTFPFIPDMNNPPDVTTNCGQCHSGSARLSLLNVRPLQAGDADMPVVCVVCHDPHAEHAYTNVLNGIYSFTNLLSGVSIIISNNQLGAVYTNQVRNPLSSTNNYSITNGTFASQYNPNINVCAQCHNDRGASWTNWNYPPHHSLQYNMLLGTVGEVPGGAPPNLPATHSQLEKQCVACHMQTEPCQSATNAAITGHSFRVQLFNVCTPCHDGQGQELVQFLNFVVSTYVSQLKESLDTWATNAAPPELRSYGTLAWEYANPGGLSSGGPGPTNAALQSLINTNIQKARFNLYSVYNDGSGGVHNPFFSINLLSNAQVWVQQQITHPTP